MPKEQDKKKEIKKELTEDELKRSSGGLRDAENGMPKGVVGPGIKPDFPFR